MPSAGIDAARFDYEPGLRLHQRRGRADLHRRDLRGHPGRRRGDARLPERITNGVYNLPGNTALLRLRRQRLRAGRCRRRRRRAAGDRLRLRPARQAGLRRRRRSPTRRSTTPTSTPTRTASSTSSWPSSPAAAATAPPSSASPAAPTPTRPYDNVWPHSSSLEFYYTDPETGLPGYTTDDQLKNLEGQPLWYTDDDRAEMTTTDMGDDLKVFVRVGPYNVNPETAIDKASVISHEYGHSLGPARLLLDRQPGDLRRLEPDGDRQVAEHGRLRPPGARLGRARGARARHAAPVRLDRLQAGHRRHHVADRRRDAVHPDARATTAGCRTPRCTSPSCPAGSCSTRRSSTPVTPPRRTTPGGRGSGNDFGCATDAARATTSTSPCPVWPTCPRAAR